MSARAWWVNLSTADVVHLLRGHDRVVIVRQPGDADQAMLGTLTDAEVARSGTPLTVLLDQEFRADPEVRAFVCRLPWGRDRVLVAVSRATSLTACLQEVVVTSVMRS